MGRGRVDARADKKEEGELVGGERKQEAPSDQLTQSKSRVQ